MADEKKEEKENVNLICFEPTLSELGFIGDNIDLTDGINDMEKRLESGDCVRVRREITQPHNEEGWGDVTHNHVGEIYEVDGDEVRINFGPHLNYWRTLMSDVEKITNDMIHNNIIQRQKNGDEPIY
eukprot:374944_1